MTVTQNVNRKEFDSDLWLGSPPGTHFLILVGLLTAKASLDKGVDLSVGTLPFSGCTLFMGSLSENLI